MSAYDVKKACYRHFEEWNDRRGYANRVVYGKGLSGYDVSLIVTETKQGAVDLERELILEYKPRDNRDKYDDYRLTREQDYGDNITDEEDDGLPF